MAERDPGDTSTLLDIMMLISTSSIRNMRTIFREHGTRGRHRRLSSVRMTPSPPEPPGLTMEQFTKAILKLMQHLVVNEVRRGSVRQAGGEKPPGSPGTRAGRLRWTSWSR